MDNQLVYLFDALMKAHLTFDISKKLDCYCNIDFWTKLSVICRNNYLNPFKQTDECYKLYEQMVWRYNYKALEIAKCLCNAKQVAVLGSKICELNKGKRNPFIKEEDYLETVIDKDFKYRSIKDKKGDKQHGK